ncbi:MAG: amidohydrolase [Thermoproteus sp.]
MRTGFRGAVYVSFKPLVKAGGIVVDRDVGEVVHIGDDVEKFADEVVDLGGRVLMPGFIDAHMHLDELGLLLNSLDLRGVRSIDEFRARLKEYAERHDGPIFGHGWDHEAMGRWPTRRDIDDIVGDRPVFLSRVDSHAAVVNTYMLKELEGLRWRPEVFLTGPSGEPLGVIKEEAFEAYRAKFLSLIPRGQKRKSLIAAIDYARNLGVTSVGFMSCSLESLYLLKELRDEGLLKIRVFVYLDKESFVKFLDSGGKFDGDEWLKVKGVKLFVDGSLGSRTALLSEPYADDPGNFGVQVASAEELRRIAEMASERGYQVAIHAIGDKAVDVAIGALKGLRGLHRIEHCSVVRDDQLPALKGVACVVQPHFVITDFWVVNRVGVGRARFVYRFRDLINSGVSVAFSTDSPVEPLNPWRTVYAAVTRGLNEGVELARYTTDQVLTVEEALHLYTKAPAEIMGEEKLGALSPGNKADAIILDRDPLMVSPSQLVDIHTSPLSA